MASKSRRVRSDLYDEWMRSRVTHGAYIGNSETPEHYVWRSMISRCTRTSDKSYPYYGGRGISVCDRWKNYENFISDMGKRPTSDHSLERKNCDQGYSPENCKWATRSEQQLNKQRTSYYFDGYCVYTLTEAARTIGISKELAHIRFKTWGSFEKGREWHKLQNQK